MSNLNEMTEVNVCLLVFSAVVTAFLLFAAISDHSRNRPFMRCFICLLAANIIMQLGEAGIWMFEGSPENIPLVKFCCVLSFGSGFLLVTFFTYCILEFFREREMVSLLPAHIMAAVCGVFLVLVLISTYNGLFFTFDEQGNFVDGPWGFLVTLFDFIAFFFEIALIFRCHRFLSLGEMLSLSGFGMLPVVSMSMVYIWYPVPEYLTTTLTMMVIFIFFHRETSRQSAEKEKELVQKELELSKSRISILMSQIEPHFLFNSLSTIKHLCRKEPKEAIEAIDKFSSFLRGSMDALAEESRITFEREMEFVDSYLYLEKKRFGDRLKIQYDIRAKDFLVPALSIQTLVENAVRHGIARKLSGGVLAIAAWEDEENFMVSITDDGIGFEVEEVSADGKSHVGIHNVRSRLSMMCGGSLEIQSAPGEGTKAVCILPKDGKGKAERDRKGKAEKEKRPRKRSAMS